MYSPPATMTISGNVDLATSTELRSALGGNNPLSAIEGNVPTQTGGGRPAARRLRLARRHHSRIDGQVPPSPARHATLGGADPASGIEGNVVTLQAFFDSIKAYEEGSLPAAIPPDGTIEIVHEA